MIPKRLLPLCAVATMLFLASCGGSDENATNGPSTPDTSSTASMPEPAVPASTIVTTPQVMFIVTHKVADYARWKTSYDKHDSLRLASGMHNYVIGRGLLDSNTILVAVKADDVVKARAFTKAASLRDAMQHSGVRGIPKMMLTITTYQDTANIGSVIRSLTTFSVKDWDAWQKGFADGKQERIDNGIVDRVYGHYANDSNKVTVVTALMDTAKAFSYFKSDILKKRRASAGVIGEPERFLFRVVQRY